MKKLLFLLLSINIFAGVVELEKLYEEQNYKEVIKEARILKSEFGNPKLHMLWAKSAEELGELDEAMSAYERVIMLDENNIDAKVALAKIYNKTKRDELALETKKDLQNYQLTPKQRDMLELIKDRDLQSIKAKAKVSLGYDSNINSSGNNKKSSSFNRFHGSVSYINDLADTKEWYLRGDLNLYYQDNVGYDYYNMFLADVGVGIGYAKNFYNIYIPMSYRVVNYLDEDLLRQIKFEPKIDISFGKSIVNMNLKYAQRSYKPSIYKIMDDSSYGIGGGFYYFSGMDFLYVKFSHENFSAENSRSIYIDRDMFTLSGGVNYGFYDRLVSRLGYKHRIGLYDDNSLSENEKREDNYRQIELKLSYYLKREMELYVSNKVIDNSSNNDSTDYTKNVVMFGLSANY